MPTSLPLSRENQAFFTLSAIEAGAMQFHAEIFLDPLPDGPATWDAPALCFLLRHSQTHAYVLFDNGIPKDKENYPPIVQDFDKLFGPIRIPYDAAGRIAAGGLDPSAVSQVIISHAHFDHVGDLSGFSNATITVGKGTQDAVRAGYPADPRAQLVQDALPEDRTRVLDPSDASLGWAPLGPFDKALDLFGDGSAYIVDAPGHIAGHINLLVRTSPDGGWACLAGDSAHDWRLVHDSKYTFATQSVMGCMMHDVEKANQHLDKIRELEKIPRVRVFLAHDVPMWEAAKAKDWEGFWPKTIASL